MAIRAIIGSSPSVGSSLLAGLINKHSKVACGEELALFSKARLYTDFPTIRANITGILKEGLSGYPYESTTAFLTNLQYYDLNKQTMRTWFFQCHEFSQLVSRFSHHLETLSNKEYWIEKTPRNALCMDLFCQLIPEAKVIHIVRDPRDVVCSLLGRGYSPRQAAERWLVAVASARKQNTSGKLIELRYEDLVKDTRNEISRLFEGLELQMENGVLTNRHNMFDIFGNRIHLSSWRAAPTEEITTTGVDRYKESGLNFSYMNKLQLTKEFASVLGTKQYTVAELAKEYGYEGIENVECSNLQKYSHWVNTVPAGERENKKHIARAKSILVSFFKRHAFTRMPRVFATQCQYSLPPVVNRTELYFE